MGALVSCAAALHLSFVLGLFFGMSTVWGQELRHKDALCNADGCFVVYFQQKTFLDSWRVCKEKGGNMATIKRKGDAVSIATLFSTLDSHNLHSKVRVWIGLQRQPRQCNSAQPLRGFSWTTGDQDTEYTNWQREDTPSMCAVPRCVTMGYSFIQQGDNFKWLDAACSVPVDGFLCHYAYKGMCGALPSEGAGNAIYATPFDVVSTVLTHVPLGSFATMPCLGPSEEDETVSCVLKEDGSVRWSGSSPLCSDLLESWCDVDNGGCQHYCRTAGSHIYCECDAGYQLGVDERSCELSDVCHGDPCEFECLPLSDGYRCDCPEGYLLGPDEHTCVDVNECLLSPCEHTCENVPGSFVCSCREGYFADGEGECKDVDECTSQPCEDAQCENTLGSYTCHCHFGFMPVPEDQNRCQDIDECQIPWTCDQMCVNYDGGFECYCEEGYELGTSDQYTCQRISEREEHSTVTSPFPWVTLRPALSWGPLDYLWNVKRESEREREMERPLQEGEQSLKWLTDPPKMFNSDVIWVTSAPRDEPPYSASVDPVTQTSHSEVEVLAETIHRTTPPIISTKLILDQNDEDTTTSLPTSWTAKTSEAAWWARPPSYKPGNPEDSTLGPNIPMDGEDKTQATLSNYLLPQEDLGPAEDDSEEITLFQKTTVSPEVTPSRPPVNEGGQKESNAWFLVGVLVPLCVFILVMLALGVFFCSRCAIMPHNKNASDCYHWISGAHDAQEASDHSQVVKSCV